MSLIYPELSKVIYDCAFEVHRHLGPGLLESAYEACLEKELMDEDIVVERQKSMPVPYKGLLLDVGYRLDLYVERKVILELKAIDEIHPIHTAQLLTYMKLANCRLGLLINFNVVLLKDGIKRYVL